MTVRVDSWDGALRELYAESWSPPLGRFRSGECFRGVARAGRSSLQHGLCRVGGDPATLERHLLRSFRKYAPSGLEHAPDATWDWLALAQHHGLPTRLIDWTYSPLVALHFVTEDLSARAEDGAVWCLDYVAAKARLPRSLARVLDGEGADVFTPELLGRAVSTLEELASLSAAPSLLFLEPPSLDARIVSQYALFSLLTSVESDLHVWLNAHPRLGRLVVIDKRAKLEIRDKLDQANLTERVLYPGLDGLCRWLSRYYEQRTPEPDRAIEPARKPARRRRRLPRSR